MDATMLEWGVKNGGIKGRALWGMRAIHEQRTKRPFLDVVPDRCGFAKAPGAETASAPDALIQALNGYAGRKGILARLKDMVAEDMIKQDDEGEFTVADRKWGQFRTVWRARGGYVYVTVAWQPEGEVIW